MKVNLETFPCGSSPICKKIECCQHPKQWKSDFERELLENRMTYPTMIVYKGEHYVKLKEILGE